MNVIPVEVQGRTGLLAGKYQFDLPEGFANLATGPRYEIGVRPEFVKLSQDGQGLPVKVQRVDDIGRLKVARVTLDGVALNVVAPEGAAIDGETSHIRFEHGHVHLYADGHLVGGSAG
jgi:glycerol transport system ATP-binding protein